VHCETHRVRPGHVHRREAPSAWSPDRQATFLRPGPLPGGDCGVRLGRLRDVRLRHAPTPPAAPDERGTDTGHHHHDDGGVETPRLGAYNTSEDAAFALGNPEDPEEGVGAWIRTGVAEYTIAPGMAAEIPFELTVLEDATPGDHAGAILAAKVDLEEGWRHREPPPGIRTVPSSTVSSAKRVRFIDPPAWIVPA
jgi:hypothetical protein